MPKKHQAQKAPVVEFIGKPAYYLILILFIGSLYSLQALLVGSFYILKTLLVGLLYFVSFLGFCVRKFVENIIISAVQTRANAAAFIQNSLQLLVDQNKQLKKKRKKLPSLVLPKLELPKLPKLRFPKFTRRNASFRYLPALLVIIMFSGFAFWAIILHDLPAPESLATRNIQISTKIYDRNGLPLFKFYKEENRTPKNLADIPQHVRLATLAAEDAEFYNHPGVSFRGITRSIFRNLEKGELTGGSTITQQLVKNALLTPEKTWTRKLKEVALAIQAELTFTKDEILEMYLNEVSYGGTAYGIEEASMAYFGKSVTELDLAEAAYLAGLPRSPSKYSAFSGNFEAGMNRFKDVLNLMVINKFITREQEAEAREKKLAFAKNEIDIKAPHFVMYVRQLLAESYGEDVVETGGLEVHTTLDYGIQAMAEEVLKSEIDNLKRLNVGNGSVVILDPKTGGILAMVGSKDYFDVANEGNVNATIQARPPGSSIKLVNYAYALSHNYTPSTTVDDSPITYPLPGQPPYSPRNYDGKFHGITTVRNALAQSLNIPAVKILNSYGVKNMIDLGRKMGITTWEDESRFGLSLTLGGGEVKLLDLTQAYATVANYGEKNNAFAIKKVTNHKATVLEENDCTPKEKDFREFIVNKFTAQASEADVPVCVGEEVLDPRVAYLLIDILKDNNARAPAFGRLSQLVIPNHPEVAVKTGTSNDLRDNLTVGMNQDYVVGVWVGNFDNRPMSRIASGLTGASTIWNGIMKRLLAKKESVAWEVPSGLAQVPICTVTGSLPCEGCPTRVEWFLAEKKPTLACRSEQVVAYQEERARRQQGQILDEAARTESE